jgi:hypothetical protein
MGRETPKSVRRVNISVKDSSRIGHPTSRRHAQPRTDRRVDGPAVLPALSHGAIVVLYPAVGIAYFVQMLILNREVLDTEPGVNEFIATPE